MPSSAPQNSNEPRGLLHNLLAAFSGVLFGLFLSKLRAPKPQSSNTTEPQGSTTDEFQQLTENPVRVVVERIPPSTPQQETRENDRQGRERKNLWIQGIIAFFACGYAAVAFCQWRAQINALKVDQRAWVGMGAPMIADKINYEGPKLTWSGSDGVVHTPNTPNPLIHTGTLLKNFGKTPAFDVAVMVNTANQETLDQESNLQCTWAEDASTGKSARQNGKPNYKWPTYGVAIFPQDTAYKSFEIPGGDIPKLFIVGCIAYRDAFNERHKTRFCYRTPQIVVTDPAMKDGDAFRQCNTYNDAN